MYEMKGDMAGGAAVVGLIHALAARKARSVVGVVGLVENMPSGTAYKPGDIVKTLAGRTIETIDTDAEGRLVLIDALYYTASQFKPKSIVDLATLAPIRSRQHLVLSLPESSPMTTGWRRC